MNLQSKKIWIVWLILIGFLPVLCLGQSDCSETLRKAQRLYDDGFPEKAIESLEDCLEDGFSRVEEVQALRLITVIQLMENDQKADNTFKQLLKLNPEFQVDTSFKTDPADLVYLYEDFQTNPRLYVRGQFGVNYTTPRELQFYSVGNTQYEEKTYSPDFSFQVGVNVGIPVFHRNFRINSGVYFRQNAYSMDNSLFFYNGILPIDAPVGTASPDYFQVFVFESLSSIQVPLFFSLDFDKWSRYNFEKRIVVPFIYAGAAYQQILLASYPEISRESGIGSFQSDRIDDLGRQRNSSNYSLAVGGGVKIKVVRKYLTVDLRYETWLRNVVNPAYRYSDTDLIYRFGHIDSDFTLDVITLSLGYEFARYSHKRNKKTKNKTND